MSLLSRKTVDLLTSSARQVLGDSIVEKLHSAILKSFPTTRKEEILELAGSPSQVQKKLEAVGMKIPEKELPRTIYAIVKLIKPDDSLVIGVMGHRVFPAKSSKEGVRKAATYMETSIFYFNYQVHQKTPDAPPRFRISYVEVGEELRKQGIFSGASRAIAHSGAKNFPSSIIEVRGDSLLATMVVGNLLEKPHFVKIEDPKDYPIKKAIQWDFVGILQHVELLSEPEAEELQGMIASLPATIGPQEQAQAVALHNRLVDFIRKNYEQHKQEASNEVNFLFHKLKQKGGMNFIKENPSQGDLWLESWLPNTNVSKNRS